MYNTKVNMTAQIFTRYYMYKMLIKGLDYKGNDDWLEMEDYLSKIYNCDCTDCGGRDVSRPCNVESHFAKKFGRIMQHNIV